MQRRVIDTLYIDAMVLADEARSYFDEGGRADREMLDPIARVVFSCESLKVTTRLMHVIAWLLTQRAVEAGEIGARDTLDPSRRLGIAPRTDPGTLALLPETGRAVIMASIDLHNRVARLDEARAREGSALESPVRSLHQRLAMAF
ncbi:DUF1465 family protein [Sphingomonas sp. PAMC 26605]|uniref:DUF1465 family protein n=1 Tax=Sphingomonas sp. PAMC 26605 TaxID=1112214 RepID=UPI00026CCAA6